MVSLGQKLGFINFWLILAVFIQVHFKRISVAHFQMRGVRQRQLRNRSARKQRYNTVNCLFD